MAASTTNTSREIGAVTGVALLGALVSAKLSADIIARLQVLGLPKSIQQIVINGVETGLGPSSGKTHAAGPGEGKLVQEVIQAAYSAFASGLHAALYLSAILVLGSRGLQLLLARPQEPGRAGGQSGPRGLAGLTRAEARITAQTRPAGTSRASTAQWVS